MSDARYQVAGADLAVENPFEPVLAFEALQAKFGDTAPAIRRLKPGPLTSLQAASQPVV